MSKSVLMVNGQVATHVITITQTWYTPLAGPEEGYGLVPPEELKGYPAVLTESGDFHVAVNGQVFLFTQERVLGHTVTLETGVLTVTPISNGAR